MSKSNQYYANAMRITRDGIPCKVAAWVADLSPRSRAELHLGMDKSAPANVRATCANIRYPQTSYYTVQESIDRELQAAADRNAKRRAAFAIAAE